MCPTILGRIETRTFILIGPAILGAILSLLTGNEGFIVIIGIFLLQGVVLDIFFYPYVIKWQPPWLTFVLAVGEFVITYTLAQILDGRPQPIDALWFFWLTWTLAIWTKVVILPIISLSWIENAGEFRQTGWSVPPEVEPMPLLAAEPARAQGEIGLVREFSSINKIPDELRAVPAPSGVHQAPPRVVEPA